MVMDLANCSKCGQLYLRNPLRDICDRCFKEEEEQFERVYRFLRKRENRTATIPMITKATNVEAALLYKWVRKGRLLHSQFPNIGYPCNQCAAPITSGELCQECIGRLTEELAKHDELEERNKSRVSVYHAKNNQENK